MSKVNVEESLVTMHKNTNFLSRDLRDDKVLLDRIEVDVSNDNIYEGVELYKKKLLISNNVFDNMFLNNCLLDVYYNKKLIYRCMFTKKDNGIMLVVYMFHLKEGMTAFYYLDDFTLVPYPTPQAVDKLDSIQRDNNGAYSGYDVKTKQFKSRNVTDVDVFITNILTEMFALLGYVNGLTTSDKEIVEGRDVYKPVGGNSSGKKKAKGARKNKVKLVKKYTIRPELIEACDNAILKKRGYLKCNSSFTVGGHWRVYRNKQTGEVKKKIWINEFKKGEGKENKKTYVV